MVTGFMTDNTLMMLGVIPPSVQIVISHLTTSVHHLLLTFDEKEVSEFIVAEEHGRGRQRRPEQGHRLGGKYIQSENMFKTFTIYSIYWLYIYLSHRLYLSDICFRNIYNYNYNYNWCMFRLYFKYENM